jgi:RNA polymerase sigma-70 factor, ECF subfamily
MNVLRNMVAAVQMPRALTAESVDDAGRLMDEEAFRAIHSRTAAPLRAYAARTLGSAADADDIVQESYLRFLRMPAAVEDPPHVRALLFRIASNLMVDHWRRRRRERDLVDQGAAPARVSDSDVPLGLDLARTFEKLPPRERAMMWLAHVEGASHRDIAAALGLRERSVKVLLHRTRRKLAAWLQGGGPVQVHR